MAANIKKISKSGLIDKRKLEEQKYVLESHPEADIVYGSVRCFRKDTHNPADRKLSYLGPIRSGCPS
jgi:hypothetical protein